MNFLILIAFAGLSPLLFIPEYVYSQEQRIEKRCERVLPEDSTIENLGKDDAIVLRCKKIILPDEDQNEARLNEISALKEQIRLVLLKIEEVASGVTKMDPED